MNRDELKELYFDWMYRLVRNGTPSRRVSYRKLLRSLYNIDFIYEIPMDGNRAEDGIDLRYRFGSENYYDDAMIAAYLDDVPCSVLEMMIALSIRCEEHIMDDPDIGDRTGLWFWGMVSNLGLEDMSDMRFNSGIVEDAIERCLNREYGRNGEGGLFTVKRSRQDMRSVEIWYQMCWYLDEIM